MRSLLGILTLFIGTITVGQNYDPAYAPKSRRVVQEPFIPQKFDLGASIGTAWSTSQYILVEGFMGLQLFKCQMYCWAYVDASERVAAQKGETHYFSTMGFRMQLYTDESSWGPYLRLFGGVDHYIFTGTVRDVGMVGLSLGTYYFLHPGADLKLEISQGFGPLSWTFLNVGAVIKFRNL